MNKKPENNRHTMDELHQELARCVVELVKHKLDDYTQREVKYSSEGTGYIEYHLDIDDEELKSLVTKTVEDIYASFNIPSHMLNREKKY